jgi:nucleotide-binding universal stress UspA family protein
VHTIGGQDYIQFSDEYVNAQKKELDAYLAQTMMRLDTKPIKVHSELRSGNAAGEIIKLSQEGKMALVIMTGRGKSGLREWVFGSVSNKVLHSGKIPLLMMR